VRCFIALPLPPEAREALASVATRCREYSPTIFEEPVRGHRPRLSWTKIEGYHLTLAFLGEIESGAVDLAGKALDAVAGTGDIPFAFGGLGSFPPKGAPRVLFARIADGGRSATLHARIVEVLGRGAEGRGFEPHVTLARAGFGGLPVIPARLAASWLPVGGWTIKRCSLYKSELRRGGAVYTELRGVDLSGK
jgi:RNA 2',3'-cyclic 3'-phosphodiesterase